MQWLWSTVAHRSLLGAASRHTARTTGCHTWLRGGEGTEGRVGRCLRPDADQMLWSGADSLWGREVGLLKTAVRHELWILSYAQCLAHGTCVSVTSQSVNPGTNIVPLVLLANQSTDGESFPVVIYEKCSKEGPVLPVLTILSHIS